MTTHHPKKRVNSSAPDGVEGDGSIDGVTAAGDGGISAGGCSSTGLSNWMMFLVLGLGLRRATRRRIWG